MRKGMRLLRVESKSISGRRFTTYYDEQDLKEWPQENNPDADKEGLEP